MFEIFNGFLVFFVQSPKEILKIYMKGNIYIYIYIEF